jgi:nucleoside-diphosphate-sugar epimerase
MNERLLDLARALRPGPVLVTGATGRIGRRLVEVLVEADMPVRAISRNGDASIPDGARLCVADLNDPDSLMPALERVASVFHLASYAPSENDPNPEDNPLHHAVTVTGTQHLMHKAEEAGVGSLVFASSTRVIDGSSNSYAQAKKEAEQVVLASAFHLNATVLRLPPVYGFSQQGNIAQMLAAIDSGYFPSLPDFGDIRSLLHVDDAVQALLLLSSASAKGGKIYVATDLQQYSMRQIYELLCRALEKTPPSFRIPRWLLGAGATMGSVLEKMTGRKMPLNREKLHSLSHSAYFDAGGIVQELGFSPFYTLEKALPEIVRQYRER